MKYQLRPTQESDIQKLRQAYDQHRAVLYQLSTGGGKTVIGSYIMDGLVRNGKRTWFLVHRRELWRQASATLREIGVEHGIIAPGFTPSFDLVHVASVQTLVNRLDHVLPPDFIIVDECFPLGTLVDDQPIEQLKIGQLVRSYNHETGKIEYRPVVRLFKSRPKQMVKVVFIDGTFKVCTSGHPFNVKEGYYVAAGELVSGDFVCKLREPCGFLAKTSEIQIQKERIGVLRPDMCQGISPQDIIGDDGQDEQGARLGQDEEKQPHGKPGVKGQSVADVKGYGPQAANQRGEWDGCDETAGVTGSVPGGPCSSGDRGACPADEGCQGAGVADSLQDRHCPSSEHACNRGGREFSLPPIPASAGPEESSVFEYLGVDRVEVLEQGSDGTFQGLCPDGFVYNIEVEGNHNYFVGDILVHNCHHCIKTTTWGKILNRFPEARILGLTATPCRLSGEGLGIEAGGFFETMVNGPTLSELIKMGYLAPPRIFAPPSMDTSGLHKRYGEFIQKEVEELADTPKITGDAIAHYRKHSHNIPAIAFCASVKHAESVAEQFRLAGYQAASIDGTMHDNDRKGRLAALGNGGLHVLTSCELVSEGFDLPVVGTAILLRPTASLSLVMQQVGRALRIHKGKEYALILDHVGNMRRHDLEGLGLPEWDLDWSLDGETSRKKKSTEKCPVKQCPNCWACHRPAPKCPFCNHVYEVQAREIDQVEGELHPIDQEEAKARREEKKKRVITPEKIEVWQCKSLDDFIKLGQRRGYKENWAHTQWQIRGSRIQQKNSSRADMARQMGFL